MISVASFFSLSDFAILATVRGRQINVIFDQQYVDTLGVETSQPAATCASSDVADVEQDDSITVDGREYRIIGVQPDGTGVTVLRLATTTK